MGISIQEYLAGRVACPVCDASGDQEHCITALLSRQDSCILFNSMMHNQDTRTDADTKLLQELRATSNPQTVLNYYVRSQQVTQRINARSDRVNVWNVIYNTYIPNMLSQIRAGRKEDALNTIMSILGEVENKY